MNWKYLTIRLIFNHFRIFYLHKIFSFPSFIFNIILGDHGRFVHGESFLCIMQCNIKCLNFIRVDIYNNLFVTHQSWGNISSQYVPYMFPYIWELDPPHGLCVLPSNVVQGLELHTLMLLKIWHIFLMSDLQFTGAYGHESVNTMP